MIKPTIIIILEFHSNSRGADEIKDLPISIDFQI